MASHFLTLPEELLLSTLTHLECRDILRCMAVCRYLSNIIKESVQLQYQVELFADGMLDGPMSHKLSTKERLKLLLDRRDNWRKLRAQKMVTIALDDRCLAYELVSGVFAIVGNSGGPYYTQGQGQSQLTAYWLPTATEPERNIVIHNLGLLAKDFAMDPTQDLLALIEDPGSITDSMGNNIRIHLRTLSTNEKHQLSRVSVLRHDMPEANYKSTTQIADDVIGMFVSYPCVCILIWNWKTGDMLVHTYHEASLVQDFSFLSPRAYMLTVRHFEGCLEIFIFDDGPTHVASLSLPKLQDDTVLRTMHTHTGPFTAASTPDAPFYASPESRVHVLTMHYIRPFMLERNETRAVRIVVDHSALMSNITEYLKSEGGSPLVKHWDDWGPYATRALDCSYWRQWLRYVHGRRVVLPGAEMTCVFDFGLNCLREPSKPAFQQHTDPSGCKIFVFTDTVIEPTELPSGVHFEAPIITRLPYRVAKLTNAAAHDAVMIDEERLIGLNEDAEENDELGETTVMCY